MFRLTSGLPMQTAMWRLYVRPKGTGNRWDSEGPPGDRQVLVFNASKASKEGGVLACSSLFIIVHHCSFSYQPVIRCFEIYRFSNLQNCQGKATWTDPWSFIPLITCMLVTVEEAGQSLELFNSLGLASSYRAFLSRRVS
jgi:hypothetical protein